MELLHRRRSYTREREIRQPVGRVQSGPYQGPERQHHHYRRRLDQRSCCRREPQLGAHQHQEVIFLRPLYRRLLAHAPRVRDVARLVVRRPQLALRWGDRHHRGGE